jgi:hypothetical protein
MTANYVLGSTPGLWGWLFNFCLFFAGMFSDLLIVKLCLTFGFAFMLVHAVTGMPTAGAGGIAAPMPRVLPMDMLVFSAINLCVHGFAAFRLIRDERKIELRNEEEERTWRFFFRRSGMERLEFKEVVRRGSFKSYRAGDKIISGDEPMQQLCLLIEGAAEMHIAYHALKPPYKRRVASGAFFDLAVANCFGIKIGLFSKRFEATALTDCRVLSWSFKMVDEMATQAAPSVGAFWRNMLLFTVAAALNNLDELDGCTTGAVTSSGELEPPGWYEGTVRSADFDRPLAPDELPQPRLQAACSLLRRALNPLPPPGLRHTGTGFSGVPARTRLLARLEADAHSSGQASPRPRDASTSSSAVATVTVAIS